MSHSFSLSLSPHPSLSQINKHILGWGLKIDMGQQCYCNVNVIFEYINLCTRSYLLFFLSIWEWIFHLPILVILFNYSFILQIENTALPEDTQKEKLSKKKKEGNFQNVMLVFLPHTRGRYLFSQQYFSMDYSLKRVNTNTVHDRFLCLHNNKN